MSKALVVLGAGASKGLHVPPQLITSAEHAPPVANEIFRCAATNHYLRHYPGADRLSNVIRGRASERPDSLEQVMRELRDSEESARDFRQLPLFFQELFGSISDEYVTSSGNYDTLVHDLFDSPIDEVAFVTLNYDLFLDRALGTTGRGGEFKTIDSYVQRNGWMLIKLHGSVNWMRRIVADNLDGPGENFTSQRTRLLNIVENGLAGNLDDAIRVAAWAERFENVRGTGWLAYYPHLALPVDDKADPLCPDRHLEALEAFIKDCTNTLVIGVSGRDPDLFEALGALPQQANFVLVAHNSKAAKEAVQRFEEHIDFARDPTGLPIGFGDFVNRGGLRAFISACA